MYIAFGVHQPELLMLLENFPSQIADPTDKSTVLLDESGYSSLCLDSRFTDLPGLQKLDVTDPNISAKMQTTQPSLRHRHCRLFTTLTIANS